MTPNDFNFGIQSPTLGGNGWSGFSAMIPDYGATAGVANPVSSYLQTAPTSSTPNFKTGATAGGLGGLGFNMDTAKLALGGLQTLGNLWQAFQSNALARDQFNFSKDFANTNLANQIQSYNTTLEDRGRARAFTEGQTPDQAAAYIASNRLPTKTIS